MVSSVVPAGKNRYRLPKSGKMRVDALVFMKPELMRDFEEAGALDQLAGAAALPGVVADVIGMPDLHQGFGLPIGGVMAVDAQSGVVSAGAVGYDINCGVRLLSSRVPQHSMDKPLLRRLMQAIEQRIPAGVGKKTRLRELEPRLEYVVSRGAHAMVEMGYGRSEDLDCIEEGGCLAAASLDQVSQRAVQRGDQLATLGGGNHFIEIDRVDECFDRELALRFGLREGFLAVMQHSGSRGFGHQICEDYSRRMADEAGLFGIELPSRGLACAPIGSELGQGYLSAMAAAVNFAFANRQLMTHLVRQAFLEVMATSEGEMGLDLVYDLAHNIAKLEEYRGRKLLVHRKGATRALPKNHPGNPRRYRESGHPVIIPGSMGTASYLVVGEPGLHETFFSANHGAGRALSRSASRKSLGREDFERDMGEVLYNARDYRRLIDEAPAAYKDIDAVVDTMVEIGLTRKVAKLKPLAVVKGEGRES
ncbi:MAG: RtcB family protein [Firmicutes bacterium]|nr:RtcB family protein [Bacillota bacterium]